MATKLQNDSWYLKNKEYQKKKVGDRKKELAKWLLEYKKTLKCESCGFDNPAALTFHHLDPNEKETIIGTVIYKRGWCKERILTEINKCKVLCANCHLILHFDERHCSLV